MKKKILKFLPLIIAAVLCITALVVILVTCRKGNEVTEIYVLGSNEPKLSYVEGQDLDLTGGILTVVIDGEEKKVPLTSEDITVTGYDKNKTGQQVITIQHGDLTTSLTVNVLPRVLIEGYEPNYFVGDVFNKDAGKIKIANDNANGYTTVNMNDARVSLVTFDSTKAGTSTVTVDCTVNGVTYPCSFDVTIYEHSNVTFVAPGITTYYSHDDGVINVAKGNFTVTSADSKLTKNVKLSADMVSGFDLSVATFADRNNPITQTLTVTYLDKTFTYDITIIYSEVSAIEHLAKTYLANIDWTSNANLSLVMNEDQTAAALDAINTYYRLDKVDRALLSDATLKQVARAGAVAINTLFTEEFESYSATFKMQSNSTNILLIADDFDAVALDAERLTATDSQIVKLAGLLRIIEGDFPSVEIVTGNKISDYVTVYNEEAEEQMIATISHLVDVYKPLKSIPKNWTVADLTAYGDAIISSAVKISNATYFKNGHADYYTEVLSKWRENDDFFEIVYSYLLYTHEGGADFIATTMIGKSPMLPALDTWYSTLQTLVNTEFKYSDYQTTDYALADLSNLMYYYFLVNEQADNIKANGTQLEKDLYKAINGDRRLNVNAYTHDFGYLYHAQGLIDCDAYVELWETYYEVLKLYNSKKLDAVEHEELLVKMYNLFQTFTPTELYGFLCSLNNAYRFVDHTRNPEPLYVLTFDDELDGHFNLFAYILNNYYSTYLNEASQPIFEKLLLAMESYALIGYRDTAMDEFKALMAEIVVAYGNLSDTDEAEFNTLIGTGYQKYLGIYNLATGASTYTPTTEEAELLARLQITLERYLAVYNYIGGLSQENKEIPDGFYGILFSCYAESVRCYEKIISSGNSAFVSYFFEKEYQFSGMTWTLELAYANVDRMTTATLNDRDAGISDIEGNTIYVTAWELFRNYGVFEIIADMSDLLYFAFDDGIEISTAYVSDIMADIWALGTFQRSLVTYLSIDGPYYDALTWYYKDVTGLTEEGFEVADKLILAEVKARDLEDQANKAEFMSLMADVIAAYPELTNDNDKQILKTLYDKYVALYNELNA